MITPYTEVVQGKSDYTKFYGKWNGTTHFVESALEKPLHWKKPRTIFICSMGDLFHESVPFEWINKVFSITQKCPQHTFLVLTKRPERMRHYFEYVGIKYPYLNVWLGVTAENQEAADKRIPILLQIPAAKRFVSIEPMLGPVDLYKQNNMVLGFHLDWVICGGESGPRARPMHPTWIRDTRDQCNRVGIPFFFKQWGEWVDEFHPLAILGKCKQSDQFVKKVQTPYGPDYKGVYMYRVGKKKAGHLLDGEEWREKP